MLSIFAANVLNKYFFKHKYIFFNSAYSFKNLQKFQQTVPLSKVYKIFMYLPQITNHKQNKHVVNNKKILNQ